MERVLHEEMGSDVQVPSEPFFVDFLRDAPEATGDEPEDADLDAPKIYEQVLHVIHVHVYMLLLLLLIDSFI